MSKKQKRSYNTITVTATENYRCNLCGHAWSVAQQNTLPKAPKACPACRGGESISYRNTNLDSRPKGSK